MMGKKLLISLVALGFMGLSLGACGKKAPPKPPKEVEATILPTQSPSNI